MFYFSMPAVLLVRLAEMSVSRAKFMMLNRTLFVVVILITSHANGYRFNHMHRFSFSRRLDDVIDTLSVVVINHFFLPYQ